MNRLVVNPDRPNTWEIQLKDGINRLGRSDSADFTVADPSVSSSHCEITVTDGTVRLNDLGSTNGTFVNGTQVTDAQLEDGHKIRLGGIEMVFHAATPKPDALTTAPRLKISGLATHAAEPTATAASATLPPPLLPPVAMQSASTVCKFHPKVTAMWFCAKCRRSFCELCVTSRDAGAVVKKICRACAVECAPLEVEFTVPEEQGFLASVPGAFIYPFRGSGVLILIFSAMLFAAMSVVSAGIFSIVMKMAAVGYLFSYMQNIIHATAAEEKQMPEMPGMDDLFGGFMRLAGTVVMSFALILGLLVAKFYEVDIPTSALVIALLLGCIYFPMAFLVVALKDNVMACNPLVVVPSIIRVPGQYLVTVILFAGIFGVQQIGNMVSSTAGSVAFSTADMSVMFMAFGLKMVWSLTSVYLLTVNMRIMGMLYLTQKEKLGWG